MSEPRVPQGNEGRSMLFTCPHCGDPCAETVEPSVDIHPGATYTCRACRGRVVFAAMTPTEYLRGATEEGADG